MQIIKVLCEKIECELDDAHKYACLALEYRESCPQTAALFSKLAAEEMAHMDSLHKEVVRNIEQYRQSHEAIPPHMKAVYDYLHERQIRKAEKVGILQAMYKK